VFKYAQCKRSTWSRPKQNYRPASYVRLVSHILAIVALIFVNSYLFNEQIVKICKALRAKLQRFASLILFKRFITKCYLKAGFNCKKLKVGFMMWWCDETDSRPEAVYNLGSGSRLAWANDTAAHYAAIHCPRQRTIGPVVAASRHATAPISHTRPSPHRPFATTHFPSRWG